MFVVDAARDPWVNSRFRRSYLISKRMADNINALRLFISAQNSLSGKRHSNSFGLPLIPANKCQYKNLAAAVQCAQ